MDLVLVVLQRGVGNRADLGGIRSVDGRMRRRQDSRDGPNDGASSVCQAIPLVGILERRAGGSIHAFGAGL